MTRTRALIAGTATVVAALAVLLSGVLRESPQAAAGSGPVSANILQAGYAGGDTAALAVRLQDTIRSNPADGRSYGLLGLTYQQRARETGRPDFYPQSERALQRALELAPNDPVATSGLASLALARHRFREALVLGGKARALAPLTTYNLGIVGDALVELGRYEQAFDAFDRMGSLKPSLASYARVSYARQLLGRPGDAISAMELAVDAAGGRGEPTAWTRVELGNLYWSTGRVEAAARQYRAALAAFPGYVFALDALARVEAARGRYGRAAGLGQAAVDAAPLPQFVATLADIHSAAGHERAVRKQLELHGVIERVLIANGARTDLETALFDVDHRVRLPQALSRARLAHRERPSIEADDVLAWALARNGHCGEALRYSKRALRLGTLDASKFFHRGMIERCLARPQAARAWFARALETNPHFSLVWAPVARRYAR